MARTNKDVPFAIWTTKYEPKWAENVSLPPYGGTNSGRKQISRIAWRQERVKVRSQLATNEEPTPPNLNQVPWQLH